MGSIIPKLGKLNAQQTLLLKEVIRLTGWHGIVMQIHKILIFLHWLGLTTHLEVDVVLRYIKGLLPYATEERVVSVIPAGLKIRSVQEPHGTAMQYPVMA